jgi:hypothetical protein
MNAFWKSVVQMSFGLRAAEGRGATLSVAGNIFWKSVK